MQKLLQTFLKKCIAAKNENRCNFHPRKGGDYSGFVFSEEWCQTAFLQFWYRFRGKYVGVQRGAGLRWRPQNAKRFEALTEPAGETHPLALGFQ